MEIRRTNFFNIHALIEAQRKGKLAEQLNLQRNIKPYELSTEEYCAELLYTRQNSQDPGLSADDAARKEFMTKF